MSQSERAPTEVAKHFYKKHGFTEAMSIISARIQSDGAKQDTEFWLDVIKVIETLKSSHAKETGLDKSRLYHEETSSSFNKQ